MIKKILVTGSEGYIGSVMMPILKQNGFEICGLDSCFYKDGFLYEPFYDYKFIKKDIRDITISDLNGFDAVVHLAALSNDPLGKINANLTYEINYKASVKLALLAKQAGVKRFIFASSCSLYGASDKILTEDDASNPQTAYGESKILAENDISKLASSDFSPVFMRNSTAFGASPRMRFDIVVNNLTGYAHTQKEIKILSDGKAWRPLVHVKDICSAVVVALKANKDVIHNQAFNVGDNNQNYQVIQIAQNISEIYKDCVISLNPQNVSDSRNYNVCFDKLNNVLNFKATLNLEYGILELKKIYEEINLNKETFENRYFTRLEQIKYMLTNNEIDKNLEYKK